MGGSLAQGLVKPAKPSPFPRRSHLPLNFYPVFNAASANRSGTGSALAVDVGPAGPSGLPFLYVDEWNAPRITGQPEVWFPDKGDQ